MQVTDLSSWTSLSVWALEHVAKGLWVWGAKTQYSKRHETTATLPSSIMCPRIRVCRGLPVDSVPFPLSPSTCCHISVMIPHRTKCPLAFFFFLFLVVCPKAFLFLTKERWCTWSEHRQEKRSLRFLDWMGFRLLSFQRALTYLTFSSSNLQPGFLGVR